jgi:ribosomal protein L4
MKLNIQNANNETVGTLDLNDEVFGGIVKTDLIWAAVVQQNAAERRGTHATKNRALVSGGGKKPYKQKGTGGRRSDRAGRRSGARAAPCSARSRAATRSTCRRRCGWARCARRCARSCRTAW